MNNQVDVRQVLPTIRVPTLILHGAEDAIIPVEVGRYMAERIPGPRLVEIPGAGHRSVVRSNQPVTDQVERFLTELWEWSGLEEGQQARVLASVLFTDLIAST